MSSQINILEVILRSSRSVFNDHITVKFVLKLFQTYITLHHPKMVKLEYGIIDIGFILPLIYDWAIILLTMSKRPPANPSALLTSSSI